MAWPDLVNGAFEVSGGVFNLMNVWALYRAKAIRGVSLAPTAVFTLWGFWNLWYYPHLDQWLSFAGGCGIVLSNAAWVVMAIYYTRIRRERETVFDFSKNDPLKKADWDALNTALAQEPDPTADWYGALDDMRNSPKAGLRLKELLGRAPSWKSDEYTDD
jgi:hypothetical protein